MYMYVHQIIFIENHSSPACFVLTEAKAAGIGSACSHR